MALGALGLGCAGYGALIVAMLGARSPSLSAIGHFALCAVMGIGIVGWLLFFAGVSGVFSPIVFWGVAVVGIALLFYCRREFDSLFSRPQLSRLETGLCVLLALILMLDVFEGISPPADADSLAYHFALPRDFVQAGEVYFVPRAVTGAIPLLSHMTYAAAIAMGGELTLTLWSMLTGWMAALLLYVFLCRYISRSWSLLMAGLFLTTPAVLYGSGSGQVEIRSAAFVLASVFFLVRAHEDRAYRFLLLAGLCAGFYLGTKYYGLIFVGSVGLVLLVNRDGLRRATVFAIAVTLAGFQWYLWNWLNTGDPIFPTIANLAEFSDLDFWPVEFGRFFGAMLDRTELYLDRTFLNWLLYPVYSNFNIVSQLEGGRTGFGVVLFVILPLAVAGFFITGARRWELIVPVAIAVIFFAVWFFSGTTQRTRHLLPIYPLLLIGLVPMALGVARNVVLTTPLALALAAVLALQLAGQLLFSFNYVKHVVSSETRQAFLVRNVEQANVVYWINRNLPADGRVGILVRQLSYLLERPYYMMHPNYQALVDARHSQSDGRKFIAETRAQGITHVLLPASEPAYPFAKMTTRLAAEKCLVEIKRFETTPMRSRTLSQFSGRSQRGLVALYRISPENCASATRSSVR